MQNVEFTVRNAAGVVQADLADSSTKLVGILTVSSSQTIYIPEFEGRRGWAAIVGQNWNPDSAYASIANVQVSGNNLVIVISIGTFQVIYGVY